MIDSSRLKPDCAMSVMLKGCLVGGQWRKEGASLKVQCWWMTDAAPPASYGPHVHRKD